MYYEELTFDEQQFRRILAEETAIALRSGVNCFSFNLNITDNKRFSSNFIDNIYRSINYVYNFAEQGFVPRYAGLRAEGNTPFAMPECISAHTHVMLALYDCFKDAFEKHSFRCPRDVFEMAILIHDMAENKTIDVAHNDYYNISSADKKNFEVDFFTRFKYYLPKSKIDIFERASRLLKEAYSQSTPDGRVFFLCDKTAATVNPLTQYCNYRSELITAERAAPVVMPPIFFNYSEDNRPTSKEKEALKIIRGNSMPSTAVPAYELFTCDFLAVSKFVLFDDYGYFLSFLVAYTLATTGTWYPWRENAYRSKKS